VGDAGDVFGNARPNDRCPHAMMTWIFLRVRIEDLIATTNRVAKPTCLSQIAVASFGWAAIQGVLAELLNDGPHGDIAGHFPRRSASHSVTDHEQIALSVGQIRVLVQFAYAPDISPCTDV
jgi:hypothetical protein